MLYIIFKVNYCIAIDKKYFIFGICGIIVSAQVKVVRDMTPIQTCLAYIQNKFHITRYALASVAVKFISIFNFENM